MTDHKETNMNQEREQSKPKNSLTRREFLKKAGTTALGVAAGLVFPGALKNTRADAPVVEAPLPDASPEPVYTHRSYSPFTPFEAERPETKDITPLWPDKIGEFAPYNFEIVNMGTKAGIIIGKQELYDNLLARLREWGNAPEVPRRIVVYENIAQLNRESQLPYNQFFFSPETDLLGPMAWRSTKLPDGSLQLDISIPTMKDPSKIEDWSLYAGLRMLSRAVLPFLFSDKDGNYQTRDRLNLSYSRTNPFPIWETNENNTTIAGPFLAKYKNP